MKIDFIKGYMNDFEKRQMLNRLTAKTFGFDFESWVSEGYFEGDYIPYSFEKDGELISNASANIMHFSLSGAEKTYIQIGTVMTAQEYRKKGFARALIEKIINDFKDADGIYLFGNPHATGFYDKLGFLREKEYIYSLKDGSREKSKDPLLKANPKTQREQYQYAVRNTVLNSAFEQINKFSLQMFYTAGMENIYYCEKLSAFVSLENDNGFCTVASVISENKIELSEIIKRIPFDYKKLNLGFTPLPESRGLFEASPYQNTDDYYLFYLGDDLKKIEIEKLFFPMYSHA